MQTYTYTYAYTYICLCIYIYIYACMHTYIHTYVPTYIYIYMHHKGGVKRSHTVHIIECLVLVNFITDNNGLWYFRHRFSILYDHLVDTTLSTLMTMTIWWPRSNIHGHAHVPHGYPSLIVEYPAIGIRKYFDDTLATALDSSCIPCALLHHNLGVHFTWYCVHNRPLNKRKAKHGIRNWEGSYYLTSTISTNVSGNYSKHRHPDITRIAHKKLL